MCVECGENIINPICPECIMGQTIACLADKQMTGELKESEVKKINKKLAAIIKANYKEDTEEGVDCISCKNAFTICPTCMTEHFESVLSKNQIAYILSYSYSLDNLFI